RSERANARQRLPDLERVPLGKIEPIYAISQRIFVQPLARTGAAGVVRSITRQEHAHVHLVGARLEPAEPAEHAGKRSVLPAAVAFEHDLLRRLGELVPRPIHRHAVTLAQPRELAAFPARGLAGPRPDRTARERALRIRNQLVE